MVQNEGQGRAAEDERKPEVKKSPTEKLEDVTPTGSLTPGAENPDSEEIKQERSPNSE
jgi:hypothetical protein